MTENELTLKLAEYLELKNMAAELANMIKAIEDEIKALMGNAENLSAGGYTVTWRRFPVSRFDTTAFKNEHPRYYRQYLKTTHSSRFSIQNQREA